MKKIQIKSIMGEVLFECEKKDNTILKTLNEAVKSEAYLNGANLGGAYLRGADLSEANLNGANLGGAYLRGANLRGADLSEANLNGANLGGAYLRGADLSEANLSEANLRGANLRGADLSEAYLSEADLSGASFSILSFFKTNFGELSDKLTLELMRHDAEFCGIDNMNNWANGGSCPYDKMERDFYFEEKAKLWKAGKPKLRGLELFKALCRELEIKHSL